MPGTTELDPQSRKYWRQCAGVGVVILMIFVLGPVAVAAYFSLQTMKTTDWERTQGTLVSARWSEGTPSRGRLGGGGRSGLAVEYTYSVDGVEYSGDRNSIFGDSFDSEEAFRAKHVNEQGRLWVYYNPDDPSEAVLTTGFGGGMDPLFMAWGCVWIVLLPLGGWLLLSGVMALRNGKPMPEKVRRYYT